MSIRCSLFASLLALCIAGLRADGPGDNTAEKVRPVPPPGIAVPAEQRGALQGEIDNLGKEIADLQRNLQGKPALLSLLPDVEIYYNAANYALKYGEFFDAKDIPAAQELLKHGLERAKQLRAGKTPWTTATGLVVRGYRSKIDGSVQPYGLVVPASYRPDSPYKHRVDLWCHGRGENLSELRFLRDRERSFGEFTPPNAFVVHLYGRYCNANKFAGEIDGLEALAHVEAHYPIDEDRVVIRGFSMGGAACWQFAVHYPTIWAAAAPGAGFSETEDFLRVFQKEDVKPTSYERKLFHVYDCTDYAVNLFNCPTVAYSGEVDSQKQAADMMAAALAKEGMSLLHLIGPKTGHSYHPETKKLLNERIDAIVAIGREPLPRRVRFATYTLRYNQSAWITLDALDRHWERATVDAEITGPSALKVKTANVHALTLKMKPGSCPFDNSAKPTGGVTLTIDGQALSAPLAKTDRSWEAHLRKGANGWTTDAGEESGLVKRHGLQGPIDDAFLDSFLMVKPTGSPMNEKVGNWVTSEMNHATDHWRKQFRGEARIKNDDQVTDADIAAHNLVLWGDPSSNKILAKIADKLPIRWSIDGIRVGGPSFAPNNHVALLIYPNPLNPNRYVVLNSGFTFREYDYLNNARQIPKLPDFAIVDVNTPPSPRYPGKVEMAGFFDENWQLTPEQK